MIAAQSSLPQPELDRLRDELADSVKAFLASGGKIDRLNWAGQPAANSEPPMREPVLPVPVAEVVRPVKAAQVASPKRERRKVVTFAHLVDELEARPPIRKKNTSSFLAKLGRIDRKIVLVKTQLDQLERDLRKSSR